ncbi:MAG: ZIP family metal transporter, partial [Halobacteria archaeon]|nr:ZIP family metal transporter [Halobacteria archaeon]
SGIMLSASFLGLVGEGLAEGSVGAVATGGVAGALLVVVSHTVVGRVELDPREYEKADFDKLVIILGVLTVHSFPEGVAVGVSFAELGLEGGFEVAGFSVPLLAVFMTVAISIHNVPEGVAISIPLRSMGVSEGRMVWWAVFSSLPQPIGAVVAFYFVRLARDFLPFGFGFAAGAMVYLVFFDLVPEALEAGEGLESGGYPELAAGGVLGFVSMVPLAFV